MARANCPTNLKALFSVRVANIPPTVENEDVMREFSVFGEIGDFYRPVLLHRHQYSGYCFIRYVHEEEGRAAIDSMDGKVCWDVELSAAEANHQEIIFSQNTGFLTNYSLGLPERTEAEFDGSLPYNHYDMKRREQLKQLDECYTLRIDDLHPSITKEQLEDAFSAYGEIARVYLPLDLTHGMKPKGMAFVRYTRSESAQKALQAMNNAYFGVGRPITLSLNYQKSYFSQDESPAPKPKKKGGVVMHFDPY